MTRPAPSILLAYQRSWVADRAKVKVIEKSRRIGLSWAEAADDALFAASESAGDDVWYIGYNKDMAEEFISDCGWWAVQYDLAAGEVEEEVFRDQGKDILAFRIRFASGNKIVALPSRPSNLRGKHGRVVIDEAAFHDDLGELLKSAMALLIWGGQVRVISTHDGEANPFNVLVQDCRSGRKPYSVHRVDFDEALEQGLYQRICLKSGQPWSQEAQIAWRQEIIDAYGDTAQEELFCVPSQGSGSFLSRALVEQCLDGGIPVIRYSQKDEFASRPKLWRETMVDDWCAEVLLPLLAAMDPSRQSFFGEDFGRSGDLSVIIPLQERQDAVFRAPFIIELRNMPFEQQRQILFYVVSRLPRFRHGSLDARGNGQYLAEVAMQKFGADRISQVMLSESWYRDNMPPYKAAFEDRSILLPKDADIIEDHRAFKMIRGIARLPETKNVGKDRQKRHGDSGIAGVLAWHATRQDGGGEVSYKSSCKRRVAYGGAFCPGGDNDGFGRRPGRDAANRSEEHTSELQSH